VDDRFDVLLRTLPLQYASQRFKRHDKLSSPLKAHLREFAPLLILLRVYRCEIISLVASIHVLSNHSTCVMGYGDMACSTCAILSSWKVCVSAGRLRSTTKSLFSVTWLEKSRFKCLTARPLELYSCFLTFRACCSG
jgi:hypothetical protein